MLDGVPVELEKLPREQVGNAGFPKENEPKVDLGSFSLRTELLGFRGLASADDRDQHGRATIHLGNPHQRLLGWWYREQVSDGPSNRGTQRH